MECRLGRTDNQQRTVQPLRHALHKVGPYQTVVPAHYQLHHNEEGELLGFGLAAESCSLSWFSHGVQCSCLVAPNGA